MINKYVRSCIQNTKKAMPDYFKKCLQQRLKNGIGSTTECETVDEMENRLMTANWIPWIDVENVLSPGCKAFKTKDIPGYHGMLDNYKAAENLEALSKDIRRALDMETRVQLLNMYIPLYVAWRVNFAKFVRGTEIDMEIRQKRYNGKYGPNPLVPLKYMSKEELEDFFKKVN